MTDERLSEIKHELEMAGNDAEHYQEPWTVDINTADELMRELDRLRAKCNNSLANNLCPDHRDKQTGKSCLACEIDRLRADNATLADERDRLRAGLSKMAWIPRSVEYLTAILLEGCDLRKQDQYQSATAGTWRPTP